MTSHMTSATVTLYDLSIITRWVKIKAKDAVKECRLQDECIKEISKRTQGDFVVSYELCWDEEEEEEEELWCWVYVLLAGRKHCIFRKKFDTVEKMNENITSELTGKTYKCCKMSNCGELAVEDDQCEDCYVHDWTRGEECCICKEDNGHWVGMACGHLIHKACFQAMGSRKCPLCRAPSVSTKEVNF